MKPKPDLHDLADRRAAGGLDNAACRSALEAHGFTDGRAATDALDHLIAHPSADLPTAELLAACGACADPGRALFNASRLLPLEDRPRCPVPVTGLAYFLGASQHMSDLLALRPELLADLGRPFDAEGAPDRYIVAGAEAEPGRALRLAQQRDLISIAWQDLVAGLDVEQVVAMLSRLADATLIGATRGLGTDRYFAIIGLGKLGGYELNYSSDIDLIFVRPDDVGDGATADRYARDLLKLIGQQTLEGHLYRVDMRLRPEGAAGQLTRGLTSSLDYYRRKGRPWERQMLTKARVICESGDVGQRFEAGTRSWILECGLDAASVRQFKRLKAATEARVLDGDDRIDVKQAPGGIRDIETIVQFLALQHAARHPNLVTNSTLHGLERLRTSGALTSLEAARLRSAYRFLRRAENLLQVMHRLQTHRLPERRGPLARLMRLRDIDAFDSEFAEHRQRVRSIFDRHFTHAFQDIEGPSVHIAELLLDHRVDESPAQAALKDLGFHQPEASLKVLRRAAAPVSRFLPTSPRLGSAFANVAPKLLERLALLPDPDAALDRFERMTRGVGAREVLYSQLADEPELLGMLCQLAGGSPHLADQLANEPHIFDDFVDALLTGVRGTRGRRKLLDTLGKQDADPWLQLSDHRKLETLRIGVRDLCDLSTTRQTLAELSHLCIDVLRHGFDLVMSRATAEHGQPFTIRGMSAREAVGMSVVALGKVGGLEANYASDADVIFVYGADGETEGGLPNREFFTKVAEEFIAHVSGSRNNPRLYKVDTRLRPEGNKGPLVTHLRALEAYYQSPRAALFEFQSLLKARVVAGDAALGQTLLARLRRLVRGHEYGDDLAGSFRSMREKIEATAHGLDLKRGTGGMVDIEFLTQFLQLRHARSEPAILVPETPRALEIIAEHGLLREHVALWLRDTYFFFRRVEMRLQIAMGLDTKEIPTDPVSARSLAMRLGYADTADGDAAHLLRVDLEEAAAETRTWFEKLLV